MKRRRFGLSTILGRLLLGAVVLVVLEEVALRLTPFPRALEEEPPDSTAFYDRHRRPLRILLAEDRRRAVRVPLDDVSPQLIRATLAAEDRNFRTHDGVDWLALGRAMFDAVRDGRAGSGASTITQQLVKIAEPGPRTVTRKLREMWLARRVERSWSKDRILTAYLNRLDYGNLQFGIGPASEYYFGKPPSDLSPAEAALLAALPRAPSRLDPYDHFAAARSRQLWILDRMAATGALEAGALARARTEPLQLRQPEPQFAAPHFVDLLLTRRDMLPPSGGPVVTTLDLELNRLVERCLAEQLARIAEHHVTGGAVVVIHNPTGEVLALAGAGDYFRPGAGQVNGAWIPRSPGSAVKPFAYLLALQNGAGPGTVVPDVRTDFPTATGMYRPNNYNHRYHGPVSLRFALGNSLNIAAIHALTLGGGPEALHRCLISLGITTLGHPAEYYGPGLTLGNAEVRLLELTNAFAALGRLGVWREYRLLRRRDTGRGPERVLCDPREAWLLADMLADNTARASSFGLESWLAFDFPVACKTGTSSDYRDNWTMAYTPEFTVGVWIGNPDGSSMTNITGVTGAAPVMHEVMTHLHQRHGTSWFREPPGIIRQTVDPLTGHRVDAARSGAVTEKSLRPLPENAADYDERGRVILPPLYADWVASPQNQLGDLVTCAGESAQFRIVRPADGAIYYLDPDLPSSTQRITPGAEASGPVTWFCPTLPCENGSDGPQIPLRTGTHTITATDAGGRTASVRIEVRPW